MDFHFEGPETVESPKNIRSNFSLQRGLYPDTQRAVVISFQ